MARVLTLVVLLAGAAVAPGADGPAVTLHGGKMASLKITTTNGGANVTLELTIGKDTPLQVLSKDAAPMRAIAEGSDKRFKDYQQRVKKLQKAVEDAANAGDEKLVKELTDRLTQEADDLLFVPAVVAGALTYKDKSWQLVGTIRALEPDKRDKGVKRGSWTVQGELVGGAFEVGEIKSSQGIRAGGLTIVLTGPAAKDTPKGQVRATGALTLTEAGEAVLEATAVEPVKK